jgi:putative peptidoglycan lipid II flippase
MAVSTAVFPRLADQVAEGDLDSLRATISRVLRVIMFLTIPAAVGLALLREPVTQVLLQRGEFTPADTAITAAALAWYCLGIVPQAGIEIHSRGFYALGDTRTPVLLAVAAVGLNLVLSALLWEEHGHEGLAFALSTAAWMEWGLLYLLYARRTGASAAGDLQAIARFAVCAAFMALVLAATVSTFERGSNTLAAITAVAGGVAGAAIYAGLAVWWRIPELAEATSRVRAVLRRP